MPQHRRRWAKDNRRRWPHRTACVSLALLLVSCAGGGYDTGGEYDSARARRMFMAGYQDVASVYIDEISTERLALAGLGQLTTVDSTFSAVRTDRGVAITVDGARSAVYTPPAPADTAGWASLTAMALEAGRQRSPQIQALESEALYEAVFDGMLTELDSFSRYAGRDEAREHRASRDGFGGVGVRIRVVEKGVHVVSVMEETPAEAAGLEADDVIISISGEPAAGLSQRDVVRRLRRPIDSEVRVEVSREGEADPLEMVIVRAHIVPQTVRYSAEGRVAVLKISGFNQSTTRSLREKLQQAHRELGASLEGYVLDLRGNPGGLLDQAVGVSDLFLSDGRIVSTHGRHPDSHQYFNAHRESLTEDLPIVILVNGNSASASEIVAAALQDGGRAVVIGSNSYGKGTVQTVLRLPNEGELTLTWARFHAPSGYALHRRGVLPDVCTSGDVENAQEVIERLDRGLLHIAPEVRQASVDPKDEQAIAELRGHCPTRDGESEIDLQVALSLIENPALYATARDGSPETAARPHEQLSQLSR